MAGDSAGAGIILSILCLLRDHGLPLPAGAVLISPWVDLTHSFPSVTTDNPLDYIPPHGFHHMPSPAWPPPSAGDILAIEEGIVKDMIHKQHLSKEQEEVAILGFHHKDQATSNQNLAHVDSAPLSGHNMSVMIDDKVVEIVDQIQMYTTNQLLAHPLVSPVLQPSLGGLPPLLIMVGGGEMLRDEQIYLAHKAANPEKYIPADVFLDDCAHDHNRKQIKRWKPTYVQLQVWEDLCHVAPVLSFTRPAKYMYRSVAQFGAWALARAQQTEIEIMDDDNVSIISSSDTEMEDQSDDEVGTLSTEEVTEGDITANSAAAKAKATKIGKAGDPLPAFKRHMIRQRVDRHGNIFPLDPASHLPACNVPRDQIGIIKEGPVRKWMAAKLEWDTKFASQKRKVLKQRAKEMEEGYLVFGSEEVPPPSALAGRRLKGLELREEKKTKSYGLSLWSGWGSKHDEKTLEREEIADTEPETSFVSPLDGAGARPVEGAEITPGETLEHLRVPSQRRRRSHRRIIVDEHQTDHASDDEDAPVAAVDENTTAAELLALKPEVTDPQLLPAFAISQAPEQGSSSEPHLEIPDGTTKAKRPKADGIAFPFSLKTKEDRPQSMSSMTTLTSSMNVQPAKEVGVEKVEGEVET
jgi:acetyl esterase/lipase